MHAFTNVINQWFINYKPLIILEAVTLTIMYLVLTSDHLFVLWHCYQVDCEELHARKQSNQFPMRTKNGHLIEKGITFELQGIFTIPTYN